MGARGLLFELYTRQWADGNLPEDVHRLHRITRCTKAEFRKYWPEIEDLFPSIGAALRANAEVALKREEALAKVEKKRACGLLGGRRKHGEDSTRETEWKANGYHSHRQTENKQKHIEHQNGETETRSPLASQGPNRRSTASTMPLLEEAMNHGISLEMRHEDVESWFRFNVENGWTIGGKPMQNWKSCLRGWHERNSRVKIVAEIERGEPLETVDYVMVDGEGGVKYMDASEPSNPFEAGKWFRERGVQPKGRWVELV